MMTQLNNKYLLDDDYYKKVFNKFPEAVIILDKEKIIECNNLSLNLFEYSNKGDLVGKNFYDLLYYDEKIDESTAKDFKKIIKDKKSFRWLLKKANGNSFLAEVSFVKESGNFLNVFVRDVSKESEMFDLLTQKEEEYTNFFRHNNAIMLLVDPRNNKIVDANKSACEYYGYSKKELLKLKTDDINVLSKENLNKEIKKVKSGEKRAYGLKNKLSNGEIRDVKAFIEPIKINEKVLLHTIVYDVTEELDIKRKYKFLTDNDSLTKLYNKDFFINELDKRIKKNEKVSILLIDIDGFSKINDNLGHIVGDLILKEISIRLKKYKDVFDVISRFGGDEFILLYESVNIREIFEISKRILDLFNKPFIIDKHRIYLSASIGLSLYPYHGLNSSFLIKNAETAMYKAKDCKEDKIILYDKNFNSELWEQFTIENKLRNSIEKDELYIKYQPVVSTKTGKVIGAEALLRWESEEMGFIPPDKFIPIAESSGMIYKIGNWVLKNACIQNRKWIDQGFNPIFMAVNISSKQLEQLDFPDIVINILKETKLSSKFLELEITESVCAKNFDRIIKNLNKLKKLGIKISMDDFGTGYSSLNKLKELNINKLKIDKSFLMDIKKIENTKIITAIISMAKSLGVDIVAEGVETNEHLHFLKGKMCDMLQGYFFSKPVSDTTFEKLLSKKYI
ncbi:MAG: EAL domain-containing protein [Firmicutes bacterium]|nr:EAL domain-containing protein [Bacillota bacterium]